MGIIGGGCETMRYAWPKLQLQFSVRENGDTTPTDLEDPPLVRVGPHRGWPTLLNNHPVDLLVIERGIHRRPKRTPQRDPWENVVQAATPDNRPKVIIEAWRSDLNLWQYGPMSKSTTTRWRELGYTVNCRTINATAVGGAIYQDRLLIACTKVNTEANWVWDHLDRDLTVTRPMGNLLTPPGLIPKTKYMGAGREHTPKALLDPMPHQCGAWIQTEKGVRRLRTEELARGLGVPKGAEAGLSEASLHRTTSVFHWEYLSYSLQHLFDSKENSNVDTAVQTPVTETGLPPVVSAMENPLEWKPPDLTPGKPWHQQRIANLRKAAAHYPDPEAIFEDGLQRLAIH